MKRLPGRVTPKTVDPKDASIGRSPMETLSGRGVSIWLVPEEEEAASLRLLIQGLAERLGTPAFEPHVTLLPGLRGPAEEIAHTASQLLAADLEAMTVPLGPVTASPQPFRCLYLPVSPTFRLIHAHAVVRSAFAPRDQGPFEPHLSLVYGRLGDEEKRQVSSEIGASAPPKLRLWTLEVVRTEGSVAMWQRVSRLPLPRPPVGHDRKDP